MLRCLLVIFAIISSAPRANAEPFTGNQLLDACVSSDLVKSAFCAGYIASMIEGLAWGATLVAIRLDAASNAEETNDFNAAMLGYCIPPTADNRQVADVVVNSLRENPATRHETARHLIVLSLQEAFPCV